MKVKLFPPISPVPAPRVPVDTNLKGPLCPSSQVNTPSPFLPVTYTKLPEQDRPLFELIVSVPPPSMYPVAVPVNTSLPSDIRPDTGNVIEQAPKTATKETPTKTLITYIPTFLFIYGFHRFGPAEPGQGFYSFQEAKPIHPLTIKALRPPRIRLSNQSARIDKK